MTELLDNPWVQRLGFVFGGFVLGVLLEFVIIRRIHKLAEQTRFKWDDMLIGSIRGVGTIWLNVARGVPPRHMQGIVWISLRVRSIW